MGPFNVSNVFKAFTFKQRSRAKLNLLYSSAIETHPRVILIVPSRRLFLTGTFILLSFGFCLAQLRGRRGFRFDEPDSGPLVHTEGGQLVNEDTVRTARETAPHSVVWPDWTNQSGFEQDVFTFARIIFKSRPGRPTWLGWINDYPDGDLNLSYRLQQLTSLKVDPDCRVLKLTDQDLRSYPFIFVSHPEGLDLKEEEITALRLYLLNGGALMADDFWGIREWQTFENVVKRILPGRAWVDLPVDHKIFHCVFDLRPPLNHLQVPSLQLWVRDYDPTNPQSYSSFYRGEGSQQMHVRAWLDDKQRIMIIATHNTDTGDGWEREGENEIYFRQFSEPRAYPLAINIIFYLMTH